MSVVDIADARRWRELSEDEDAISGAVRAAALHSGKTRRIPCPLGRHRIEFCVKRIGERGDAKVQYMCDACGLGGEGWFPAGPWANR